MSRLAVSLLSQWLGSHQRWASLLWLLGILAWSLVGLAPVQAQVTPDGTLGTQVNRSNNTFNIRGGSRAGRNLFHSFREFSVPTGDIAHFQNDLDISNIFSRVTGLSRSQIDGMIRANGSANLFLLNPNGIVFGPNASLDVGGSFTASTADAIRFGEQGIFRATASGINPAVLQVNPSALQFNRDASQIAPIQNNSVANTGVDQAGLPILGLRVPNGESLVLLGGDVRMRRGRLIALGGRVEVGAAGEPGEVGLTTTGNALSLQFPNNLARADVFLTDRAQIDVSADRGGSVAIQAHDLQLLGNSSIYAGNYPDIVTGFGSVNSQAGDLRIDATGAITVEGGGIFNRVYSEGKGNAGNIMIHADSLSLTNGAQVSSSTRGNGNGGNISIAIDGDITADGTEQGFSSGIFSQVNSDGTGDAGNITIHADSLSLTNSAAVSSSTNGNGNGGNISITVDGEITADGTEQGYSSGIFSQVNSDGTGDAGNITIHADSLSLTNSAWVSSSTFGNGDGGDISITVDGDITADGTEQGFSSGIFSTVGSDGTGNAGNITIHADSLSLTNSARVNSSTNGSGNGGDISIAIDGDITADGTEQGFSSSIFSQVNSDATGDAGNITIHADSLSLTDGAGMSSSTFGNGDGGDISITVDGDITADGTEQVSSSGIFSTVGSDGTGNAGNITIHADSLSLTNSAQLGSSTNGNGNGGNILITVDGEITADGIEQDYPSGIFSLVDSGAKGDAGSITLNVGSLYLSNNAQVNSETKQSSEQRDRTRGDITITAEDVIGLQRDSVIITSVDNGEAQAGDIAITTPGLVITGNSDILATADQGSGGNISINAPAFLVEGVYDPARLQSFTTGTQSSDVDELRNNDQIDISATSNAARNGAISINTPNTNLLQNTVTPIAVNFTTPEQIIAGSCLARRNTESDRFVVTGTGGLPASPYDPLNSAYNLTSLLSLDSTPIAPPASTPPSVWKMGDPIEEAQGLYATTDGHILLGKTLSQTPDSAQNLICQ